MKFSLKILHAANDNLIGRTPPVWQPRLQRDLSGENVRQFTEKITGFFRILADWSRAGLPVPANDTGELAIPESSEAHHER